MGSSPAARLRAVSSVSSTGVGPSESSDFARRVFFQYRACLKWQPCRSSCPGTRRPTRPREPLPWCRSPEASAAWSVPEVVWWAAEPGSVGWASAVSAARVLAGARGWGRRRIRLRRGDELRLGRLPGYRFRRLWRLGHDRGLDGWRGGRRRRRDLRLHGNRPGDRDRLGQRRRPARHGRCAYAPLGSRGLQGLVRRPQERRTSDSVAASATVRNAGTCAPPGGPGAARTPQLEL